jgi:DNA-binding LytR/AlgR family response regulator
MRNETIKMPDFMRGVLQNLCYDPAANSVQLQWNPERIKESLYMFHWTNGKKVIRKYYSEILYFKKVGDRIFLITDEEEIPFKATWQEVMECLNTELFMQVGQNTVINLQYLTKHSFRKLTVSNDKKTVELNIGPTFRKNCMEFFRIRFSKKPKK